MIADLKIIAIPVALLILLAAGWFGFKYAYSKGDAAGSNRVQIEWDKDKAAIQAVAAASILTAFKQRDEAIQSNQVIHDQYEAELLAAHTSAHTLAERLRQYETRAAAGSGAVQQTGRGPGPSQGPATPSMGQLDDATGAALAECAAVRAGYKALIAQIKPQL